MLPGDVSVLRDRLSELAEVFDKKPVGDKGLTVWFGVLREFPTEKVAGVLIGWAKSHGKFPTPAEVWKSCNEMSISEREAKAQRENKEPIFYPGVGGEDAAKFIAKMREILRRPKWTPEEHWTMALDKYPPGSIGHTYAKAALSKVRYAKEFNGKLSADEKALLPREPGQDDEERAAA